MKLAYIANIRLPTEKAHGYQIMRVCNEWARQGHVVVAYVPARDNNISTDAFSYYGLEKNFTIEYIACRNWMRYVRWLGRFAFWAQAYVFMRATVRKLSPDALIYTRDAEVVWYLGRYGYTCVFNAHNWPRRRKLIAYMLKRVRGIVCNSQGTATIARQITQVPVMVAYNATDSNPFVGMQKEVLCKELSLPTDKKIILYSGHLYNWKGVDVFLSCARLLEPYPEFLFVCIGGTQTDVVRMKHKAASMQGVLLLGNQPKAIVPKYLAAAHVLVLPNTRATEESIQFTSPLKMFEYMASGTPIVASDLPSLKEVLSEETAFFAEAGSSESLAHAITKVLTDTQEAEVRAKAALVLSKEYTWQAHAQKTLGFIDSVAVE